MVPPMMLRKWRELFPNASGVVKPIIDVKYIWNNSYIWAAVVDQSEEWSSREIFQFQRLERGSLKNQGFNGIRTRRGQFCSHMAQSGLKGLEKM